MCLFALLQLFTMCGLCRSKDYKYQDKIEFDDMQLVQEEASEQYNIELGKMDTAVNESIRKV
jgi:hypothetical protein